MPRPGLLLAPLVFVAGFVLAGASCHAQDSPSDPVHVPGLGALHFPNSGAEEAQDAFRRGVLLLHSFEYAPAADAFREAQRIDPDFALAYWGEAMTYNHPLWREVNVDRARAALARYAPSPQARLAKTADPRERMYLEAVEALFGEGTKAERDRAYMEAMDRLHAAYPDDDEARAFYALSILGSTNGERDYEVYGRAARTAAPILARNPHHPGAAHYVIHSYDDPEHAHLGLDAANAYSGIAPEAAHAQHMTTHIFVALGIWDRVVENNIRAMEVQNAALVAAGREPNHCGHYSSWRHYGHLQLGQFVDAEALMDACYESILDGGSEAEWDYFASMRALHMIDTEDWSLADRWQEEPPEFDVSNAMPGSTTPRATYEFSNALAAIRSGDAAAVGAILRNFPSDGGGDDVLRMELEGLLLIHAGRVDEGLTMLEEAADLEASASFMYGPPSIVKPAHELLAEELARAGRTAEAAAAYERALARTPGRRVTVAGAERIRTAN